MAAVGADHILALAAEGSRRHIGVEPRGQGPRRAVRQTGAVQRLHEQVVAAAVVPAVPGPQRQPVIGLDRGRARRARPQPVAGAGQLGAVDEHRQHQHQRVPRWRDTEAGHIHRRGGDLGRRLALGVGAPDLAGAAPSGEEVDGPTVGAPAPVAGAPVGHGQSPGRAVAVDQPQLADAAVAVPVGGAHVIEQPPAVRRQLRIRDPLHHGQLLQAQPAGRRRRGRRGGLAEGGAGGAQQEGGDEGDAHV